MPRAKREEADPTQLRNSVGVMFDDHDIEQIMAVAADYSMTKSAAVRFLTRRALKDPTLHPQQSES